LFGRVRAEQLVSIAGRAAHRPLYPVARDFHADDLAFLNTVEERRKRDFRGIGTKRLREVPDQYSNDNEHHPEQ
jgi:hypothetical protein